MGEKPSRAGSSGLRYAGVGLSFAAIVAAGWLLGRWADQRFDTTPWLSLAGSLVGITLATYDLIRTTAALERRDKEDE